MQRPRRRTPALPGLLALWSIAALWCGFFAGTALIAQQPKPNEYQVKATYLYNFGRIRSNGPKPLQQEKAIPSPICVLGQDPFGPVLDSTLAGEALDGKPVVAAPTFKATRRGRMPNPLYQHNGRKTLERII